MSLSKIKISAVSYLNTKPLLHGLSNHPIAEKLDISLDIPSVCASKLVNQEVDIAFAPVAILSNLPGAKIISDFCISCNGAVRTVCLFSDCPIEEVEEIYLDYQSRTSVQLLKILLKDYWKIEPKLLSSQVGFESKIKNKTAALVIGDRAIDMFHQHPFVYDLGACWKQLHNLPFVFAGWMSQKKFEPSFMADFNAALASGLAQREEVIAIEQKKYGDFDVHKYLYEYIEFDMNEKKREALAIFLESMNEKKAKAL